MAMIQESLTYYICRRLQTAKWQHLHFELSGATVKVRAPTFLPASSINFIRSSVTAVRQREERQYLSFGYCVGPVHVKACILSERTDAQGA